MMGSFFEQINEIKKQPAAETPQAPGILTLREEEVLFQIAKGKSTKDIASTLNIAPDTVKSHVRNILEKLNLHSRLELAHYVHSRVEAP